MNTANTNLRADPKIISIRLKVWLSIILVALELIRFTNSYADSVQTTYSISNCSCVSKIDPICTDVYGNDYQKWMRIEEPKQRALFLMKFQNGESMMRQFPTGPEDKCTWLEDQFDCQLTMIGVGMFTSVHKYLAFNKYVEVIYAKDKIIDATGKVIEIVKQDVKRTCDAKPAAWPK